jgi:hypothetical protein
VTNRFHLDDLARVREVFPNTERYLWEDAFVFPSTESAVRYYASGMVDAIAHPPADASHRDQLLPLVAEGIQAIIDREGVFKDAKDSGCFVASTS